VSIDGPLTESQSLEVTAGSSSGERQFPGTARPHHAGAWWEDRCGPRPLCHGCVGRQPFWVVLLLAQRGMG
jgi:hypothetical protein